MRSLTGKTALITGGAGGIGLGMAQALARGNEAHIGERIDAFGKPLDPATAEKIRNSLNGQINKGLH